MSTLEMKKLKSLLQESAIKLSDKDSVSFGAVIQELRKSDPKAIHAVTQELEDGMMHRLLSQIALRRPKAQEGQLDMFAGYSGLVQLIAINTVRDGRHITEFKQLPKAKLRDLATWLAADRKTTATRRQRNPGMAKLLRDLSKVSKGSDSMTVEQAMKLLRGKGG